ncbi:tRNA-queuosine alpha-mannosyltransferase domain-containing protein [Chloroflexus sp.]|uniref:tRNA-queuosine alpha-mannosyltransferase domain-containing protein n=1 Tax=Chloroflexus sp. TaxID=1904827 RepID=UPI0040494CBC
MVIWWLDPFHGGSHAAVASGYAARSSHRVRLITLGQAGGWRWRMRGGAVTLARLVGGLSERPDVIVATDMLDLASFRALTCRQLGHIPVALYFHENQLTYPIPPERKRDYTFAWINFTSALVADAVLFNSAFHRRDWLAALPGMLRRYHDYHELQTVEQIATKAQVLPPGLDLPTLPPRRPRDPTAPPVILWNARWEYDKQPHVVMAALEYLAEHGVSFRLIVTGEHIDPNAPNLIAARQRWADHAIHWGYAGDRQTYLALLRQADIVVSAAIQEYFGIAILEAIACGCVPLLPARLNYPDLIPPEWHADCLYAGDPDLPNALERLIGNLPRLMRYDWSAVARPYRWENLVAQYDATLAALVR